MRAAEHVADDVGAVQPRRHVAAVADVAVDEGHVMHAVERRHIGIALERADLGRRPGTRRRARPACRASAGRRSGRRPRPASSLCLSAKAATSRPAHHRAVVVHQFGQHADRRQAGEPAQIDAGFGMAGAHQHAALARDQREDVAGADEIGGAAVVVGERAHGVACAPRPRCRWSAPWRTSTETVKAVPSGASLSATIGSRCRRARQLARRAARRRCRRCGG